MADSENETSILPLTSLLRTVGKIGRPSGRGLFMFRALTTSTLCAGLVGLTCGIVAGFSMLGGGQFFLIGSCFGFVGSAISFYKSQVREAFIAFDTYPELMRLHLIMNFPTVRWDHMKLGPEARIEERLRIQQSWALTSMLASAYQTASPSIDEINTRREQNLIHELSKNE